MQIINLLIFLLNQLLKLLFIATTLHTAKILSLDTRHFEFVTWSLSWLYFIRIGLLILLLSRSVSRTNSSILNRFIGLLTLNEGLVDLWIIVWSYQSRSFLSIIRNILETLQLRFKYIQQFFDVRWSTTNQFLYLSFS